MFRGGVAAATAVAATFVIAGAAPASVPYDVYACRSPDGTPAPVDGWTPSGASGNVGLTVTCGAASAAPERRALSADFYGAIEKGQVATWGFAAPVDTYIANATLWRAAHPDTQSGVAYWHVDSDEDRAGAGPRLETCMDWEVPDCKGVGSFDAPLAPGNRVDFSGMRATMLGANLRCGGAPPDPCQSSARFKIFGVRIGLLDERAPEVTDVSGTLTGAGPPLEGPKTLSFAASDRGGGISTVGVLVDGVERATRPAGVPAHECRPPYTSRVPCPLGTTAAVSLDTASLDDGTHEVAAFATDVSGNRGTSDPFVITTRNASYPNGTAATRDVRLRASLTTRTGRRVVHPLPSGGRAVLAGTLVTAAGAPIAGARLDISVRSSRPGAAPHARTTTTGANGRFVYAVPAGSSRVIDVGYRAFSLDAGYAATASATLRVRAAATLKATPRVLRNGQRVRFSGRLRGGPYRQDASMILYALAGGGRRIPVTSLRANSAGRFSYTYRFRTVTERSSFRFQVQVESRPSYPYAAGRSNRATVVVRP